MNTRTLLAAFVFTSVTAATAQTTFLHFPAREGPGKGKKVVLLAGDDEYRSEEAMPMLGKILSQHHGFDCTVLFSADEQGNIKPEGHALLTNPTALDSAELIVMSLRFRQWNDDAMKKFDAAYRRGVPFVALRTSTHAFAGLKGDYAHYNFDSGKTWTGGFGKQVLGETWVAHHGDHKVEGARTVPPRDRKFRPLLSSVGTIFAESDVYTASPPADADILLRGEVTETLKPDSPAVKNKKNDPMQPVAWTRLHKNEEGKTNRVFTTTMGAASDLDDENLRRLIVNAVFWGLELEVPAKANVTPVDPIKPTMFGFGSERKGIRVEDNALGKSLE
jgi:Trehalose utilisation